MVGEIAARRRIDIAAEVAGLPRRDIDARAEAAPAPRPIAERLAAPGLHLIAEIKRASPSAGRIAAAGEDIVARARAYEAGGAAAISVLCEPHWFGGSIDDLRAVRAAVAVPVLAKDFVVDEVQLPLLRAAGADLVLLLAVLHPARRLARLVERALAVGLEPLVEVHDPRELDRALASGARLIGLNNRDLRTLEVDVERAGRLRDLVPDDRLVIAESGVREPRTVARWRALGFDGALVGEALVRAGDPAAAARAFVAAGAAPDDPANVARRPFVKICGVTDEAGVLAAVAAGADAIGLNVVDGTPRALALDEAAALARLARTAGAGDRRPLVVAITADADRARIEAAIAAFDPDAVQLSGDEALGAGVSHRAAGLEGAPHARPPSRRRLASVAGEIESRARAYLAAGAERILLDTAGGPHPGGTGTRGAERARRRDRSRRAGHPRRRPRPGQRRSRPARDPGRRGRRRVGGGAAARSGTASRQGPVQGRPLRQAGASRPRRPPQPAVRPDAGPSRAARRRWRRSMGAGARLRRALRAGDPDGRARAARDGL